MLSVYWVSQVVLLLKSEMTEQTSVTASKYSQPTLVPTYTCLSPLTVYHRELTGLASFEGMSLSLGEMSHLHSSNPSGVSGTGGYGRGRGVRAHPHTPVASSNLEWTDDFNLDYLSFDDLELQYPSYDEPM